MLKDYMLVGGHAKNFLAVHWSWASMASVIHNCVDIVIVAEVLVYSSCHC